MNGQRVRDALKAGAQGLLLSLLSVGVSLLLFVLFVVSLAFVLLGLGLFTTPVIVDAIRAHANQRRMFARDWYGISIHAGYRPLHGGPRPGLAGQVERTVHMLKDPATWRDAGWLLVDAVAGFILALLPWTLLGYALYGLVLVAGVWRPIVDAGGTFWFAFVPISSWFTAVLAALTGIGLGVVGLFYNPLLIRGHFYLTRALIGASEKRLLAQRVARLTETRHDALDNSAAELRRIERDLHDGAQARLVAMGMSLGTIEALIEKDPEQAKRLLAQARENSAEALSELRDLVRGIHPPVLAERGLGDAARALALRTQLPVEVDVELPGRLEEPVESAAYFAISEVLTNAAKHAEAERAWLDIYYSRKDQTLRIAITDNGRGGASPEGGSGLRGLERRLGAFDGVLALSSPVGGPTLVTIEIPCALTEPGRRTTLR
ncbi:sensor histidine kinase [Streptomyces litchfieldiae]|uniref:histidine kinase n=1 Tax=Streptomyces litchfieldiae TaxID=3075543 RepID=A0ABU2MSL6_9ACTN|nr:sensor histidine kinase [Streptomyces sp. DSM 44938]MDT0344629.1 sensor histidine kinase [Streptomyces sp. DSM 44938]